MISIEKTTKRFTLRMEILRMGKDLCVALHGGDTPHIGAVALAVPHPGIGDKNKTDASVSLLTVTGHKEDELARKIAYNLATEKDCTVSVSCGIHLDSATPKEIAEVLAVTDELLEEAKSEIISL